MKAIIFDIGNVLVKVDLNLWIKSFKEIGIELPKSLLKNQEFYELIYKHGTGKISTSKLIQQFPNKKGTHKIAFDQFKEAWNTVIVSFYPNSIDAIKILRSQGYQIYALSDTNEIHIVYLEELYQELHPNQQFLKLFDKSYLSHITGYGKNQDEAWLQILKEQNLKPEECLFVDDLSSNIERAKKLGLHAFHFTPQSTMQAVFNQLAILNKNTV